jgi:hypothetical protein
MAVHTLAVDEDLVVDHVHEHLAEAASPDPRSTPPGWQGSQEEREGGVNTSPR